LEGKEKVEEDGQECHEGVRCTYVAFTIPMYAAGRYGLSLDDVFRT
jgi:hypothetical protein